MIINTLTLDSDDFPDVLRQIPSPPKVLFHAGSPLPELLSRPRVAIVGSRNVSTYGQQVTRQLAGKLAEQGIVIISGLAYGVDGIAHQAALDANGLTIAVLPGPIEQISPARHSQLAQRIVEQGGALISEYPDGADVFKPNFIARNRLVSGLSQILLVTEAAKQSGTTHTVGFARKQQKVVMAVPGNVTNLGSAGTNALIQQGAGLVASYLDVLHALGVEQHETAAHQVQGRTESEQRLLDLMLDGTSDGEKLLKQSALGVTEFSQVLTMLEIDGKILSLGSNRWAIR